MLLAPRSARANALFIVLEAAENRGCDKLCLARDEIDCTNTTPHDRCNKLYGRIARAPSGKQTAPAAGRYRKTGLLK
jgi:hypothetical protein